MLAPPASPSAVRNPCGGTLVAVLRSDLWHGLFVAPLPPPRRVTVIINPYGGTRKAPQVFQNHVRPMFERAGVQFNVIGTRPRTRSIEIDGGGDGGGEPAKLTPGCLG